MARIALNARLLIPGRLEGIGGFAHAIFSRWVALRPEHEFLLLFDRMPDAQFQYGPRARSVMLPPPARRPWLYDLWFDAAVPLALRAWGADAFVSPEGFLSRRTGVPQAVVMHDLNFLHRPDWLPAREAAHYRARVGDAARRARQVITVSDFSANDIAARLGVERAGIAVVPNAPAGAYRPREAAERAAARQRWNAGRPYLTFVGSLHPRKNLPGMLTAFEAYRAAGGTADLLVVGDHMWGDARQPQEGVRYVGRLSTGDLAELMGGAEALLYLPFFEGFGVPAVEAFASGIPVVASSVTAVPEVCGGAAAALVDPYAADAPQAAAAALLRLERDPAFWSDRSRAGLARAEAFSWDRSAAQFAAVIDHMLPRP
jgi:glycosyltransferase involved in cell wall biosynthesis